MSRIFQKIILCLTLLVVWNIPAHGTGGMRIQNGNLTRSWAPIPLPEGDDEFSSVERFIQENHLLLGLQQYPDVQVDLQKSIATAIGQRYVFSQYFKDLPVFEAQLILVTANGEIRSLFNAHSKVYFIDVLPSFNSAAALRIAQHALRINESRREPNIALGYDLQGSLVYRVRIPGLDPPADWEVWIDAVTGEVLRQLDRRLFVDGLGQIFDPDPKTVLEDTTLTDQGDSNAAIPFEAYSIVTLPELNDSVGGYFYLDGPYVSTEPTENRAFSSTPDFIFLRENDWFEEVMVYYHLDREQRYFQNELQTLNANNHQQRCNVNFTSLDNSWFSQDDTTIYFGYGGVDDAEDADVILHEYGHAVHFDIYSDWNYGHTGGMGEGYGDYLAGSYSLAVNPTFQPDWVFNWDGHNEFWAGRVLNAPYHYPEDADTTLWDIYHAGQLWSAGLIDVWWDIPDVIAWDRIILQHHFLLGNGALMEDAAEAILTTELELYGGIYRSLIIDNFVERGFVDPSSYYPLIVHDPLGDTEDTLQTEFEVVAQITSDIPLDTASLQLFWRADEAPYNPVILNPTGTLNEYSGNIPGPFNQQIVSYYLTAADTLGMASLLPEGAPTESFVFYVGPDTCPPAIAWTDSLGETVFRTASKEVQTVVTDNIGIASAELRWRVDSGIWLLAQMLPVADDTFSATLSYTNLSIGQNVEYFVRATDSSSQQNMLDGPTQSFPIVASAQLDDFEGSIGPWLFTGNWGLTQEDSHSGFTCIEDSPGSQYLPNSDTWAEWDESWDLSDFDQAYLTFWEKHLLEFNSDWGRFEVSADNGPWMPLLQVTGPDLNWNRCEIVLTDYCGGTCSDFRFRFRTITDSTGSAFGWFIDDLSISVDNLVIVENSTDTNQLPTHFALGPIYPNPFNPFVFIGFDLPVASKIRITMFNTKGQAIDVLTDGFYPAGSHQVHFDGTHVASGIYLCRFDSESFQSTRKLILLK